MCKIFGMNNTTKLAKQIKDGTFKHLQIESMTDFYEELRGIMAHANRDGFGMSCLADNLDLTANYWQLNSDDPLNFGDIELDSHYPGEIFKSSGGKYKHDNIAAFDAPTSLIAHSRTSTNSISLSHVHPFKNHDDTLSFIHNGVVNCDSLEYFIDTMMLETDNDSEMLKELYCTLGDDVSSVLSGYMATMSLSATTRELHIMKDDYAQLYGYYWADMQTYIFATTKDMITDLLFIFDVEPSEVVKIRDLVSFRLDSQGIIDSNSIAPLNSYVLSSKEKLAFKDYKYGDNYLDDKYGLDYAY